MSGSRRSGRSDARRLEIANAQIRRDIPLWGRGGRACRDHDRPSRHVTREEIEESLADVDGAYRRLRRIMDAWCALWFWPLTETRSRRHASSSGTTRSTMILGRTRSAKVRRPGDATSPTADAGTTLDAAEDPT